jgi:hypothetical protein
MALSPFSVGKTSESESGGKLDQTWIVDVTRNSPLPRNHGLPCFPSRRKANLLLKPTSRSLRSTVSKAKPRKHKKCGVSKSQGFAPAVDRPQGKIGNPKFCRSLRSCSMDWTRIA